MESHVVAADAEGSGRKDEADWIDGLFEAEGTPETSLLTDLGETSHVGAQDETKSKCYKCRFCDRVFGKYQALGGHMNGHPEARNQEKMEEYEKFMKKMHLFKGMDQRESMAETSALYFPFSRSNQPGESVNMVSHMTPIQPARLTHQQQQNMEFFHEPQWCTEPPPVNQSYQHSPQIWTGQAPPDDLDENDGVPANIFTNTSNMPTPYGASGAAVNANYGLQPMDSSQSPLISQQYNLPTPSSMSSGSSAPFRCSMLNSIDSGTSEDLQVSRHSLNVLEQYKNSSSTLNRNPSTSLMPPTTQMSNSTYVQHAQDSPTSGMGTQGTATPQGTSFIPNSLDEYNSHNFNKWSQGMPTDVNYYPEQ